MKFNNKKLEKTSIIINYTIAVLLCGFLVLITDLLIDDIDDWKERPPIEQFQNVDFLQKQEISIEKLNEEIRPIEDNKSRVERTIKIAKNNYVNEKKSFDNWLEARKTVGSPREDKEVLKRAEKLDNYYKTQQEWEMELAVINDSIKNLEEGKNKFHKLISKERVSALVEQTKAFHDYEVKIFLIRLLIILTLMLLSIYFILKFRKHKYWPL